MVFRRFFERSTPQTPDTELSAPEPEDHEPLDESEALDADEAEPEGEPEDAPPIDFAARAAAVLPTGASTGSKRPQALYGIADVRDVVGPTHFRHAAGCIVTTATGEELVDCTMALGAVALGYAEPRVTRAVVDAAAFGNVSGLSPVAEIELAERLCGIVPCAERVQFLKTGAEAIAAAVRLARTYTGRDRVIACGYFGWLDWSSDAAGVPRATREELLRIPFDDIAALDQAVEQAGDTLAAIVVEPVIERLPSPEWMARLREQCDRHGAALIFDEVKTGFRLRPGGYQELSGVTPDLTAFGKAMANGYPLAAVMGRESLMLSARETWISSTLASETTALAAALAVLDWHEEADICDTLWTLGREMKGRVAQAIEASGIAGVDVLGIDPMWLLRWDSPARETRFLELAVEHGVLFKRGAYNYASVAHDEVLDDIERAASAAFVALCAEDERA